MNGKANSNRDSMTKITWTGKTGKTAAVTINLVTERTVSHYCDGHRTEITKPCCEIEIEGSVEGMGVLGRSVRRIDNPAAAGCCGRLGIPEEQMVLIEAAIAEIKASPEWVAKLAREAQQDRMHAEYQADHDRVVKAMSR
jgi:hypothetical protein